MVNELLSTTPKKLPCAAFYEMDSYEPKEMVDSSGEEVYTDVTWQLTVYSAKVAGKKTECKNIFKMIDAQMKSLGFHRESSTPEIPTNENTIAWLSARYTARVKNNTIYNQ